MAINVQYKMPAALLQAEQDKERRQYNRQLSLQRNQQNFQREMADRQYARQLELGQIQADRQTDQRNAQFAQQMDLLDARQSYAQQQAQQQRDWQLEDRQSQWDRQDALFQSAQQMQSQQEADALEKQMWQQSEILRQQAEKQYAYTDAQKEQLAALSQSERDLSTQYVKGMLTPDEYTRALKQIRIQRSSIMPETPIVKPTPQEEYNASVAVDEQTGIRMKKNSKGEWEPVYDEQDTAKRKAEADKMKLRSDIYTAINKVALEFIKSGQLTMENYQSFVDGEFKRRWDQTPYGQEETAQEAARQQAEKEQRDAEKRRAQEFAEEMKRQGEEQKRQHKAEKTKADKRLGKEKKPYMEIYEMFPMY